VTVPVTGMRMMRATRMMMPSCVRDIAGNGKGRGNSRTRQEAVTKPRMGFAIHRCHCSPVPNAPHPVRRPLALFPISGAVPARKALDFPCPQDEHHSNSLVSPRTRQAS
jgi:hypothetical protein